MGSVDQGFVPAAPDRVYARLSDVRGYGAWWPGARTRVAGALTELRAGALDGTVRIEAERPGMGLVIRIEGRGRGSLEWYLEPFKEGTVVNAILDLSRRRGRARGELRTRRSLRDALVALRAWADRP